MERSKLLINQIRHTLETLNGLMELDKITHGEIPKKEIDDLIIVYNKNFNAIYNYLYNENKETERIYKESFKMVEKVKGECEYILPSKTEFIEVMI